MDALHRYLDPDSLSFRRIEVAIAALTLLAIGSFLVLALGSDATGFVNDATQSPLWVAAGTTLFLPALIVLHFIYDALALLRGRRDGIDLGDASALLDAVFRTGELLLSLVIIAILGSAAYLFARVTPGRGAGTIVMWVVFASGIAVCLLSVTVLLRQAVSRV